MNHDPLHELWHSTANQPDAAAERRAAEQFAGRWRRRRRWQAVWLTWTFLALTAATGLVAVQLGRGSIDLARQGPLLALLGAPWLAAIHFLRLFLREGANALAAAQPFTEVLRRAQAVNAAERRRLRLVGVLLGAMAPITALTVWQLHVAGKASASEAWSMGAVFAFGLAAGGGFAAWRYWARLQPERLLLEARLRELNAATAN